MFIETTTNEDGDNVCQFIFGDEKEFDSKITYQLQGDINELGLKMPFNSELMKLNFTSDNTTSEYFIVRKVGEDF